MMRWPDGHEAKRGRDPRLVGRIPSVRCDAGGVLPASRHSGRHAGLLPSPGTTQGPATTGTSQTDGAALRTVGKLRAGAAQRAPHRERLEFPRRRSGPPDPPRGGPLSMFGVGPATKIYISLDGVDMRKGFDGLYGLVRDHLGQDPQSGHLFLFTNRARTRLKVLGWDRSGLWVCAKRLERGRFGWPVANGSRNATMRPAELAML